ncbi:hypothetical protein G6L37_06190 [Agrobacterium rubi]|nr:hypothetical protein [Agrobacterium rubi]NTF24951.1 hypothetical protein [Agrobacterium rubi]
MHRLIENAFSWALQDCNYLNPKYMDRLIQETSAGMKPEQAADWNATAPEQAARSLEMESNEMTDLTKLASAVDLAQTRLETKLNGIRHISAQPVVRQISTLIEAHIALAAAEANDANSVKQALISLVEACEGEVEEVFSGEIGDAMKRARATLLSGSPD